MSNLGLKEKREDEREDEGEPVDVELNFEKKRAGTFRRQGSLGSLGCLSCQWQCAYFSFHAAHNANYTLRGREPHLAFLRILKLVCRGVSRMTTLERSTRNSQGFGRRPPHGSTTGRSTGDRRWLLLLLEWRGSKCGSIR